jgi:hypothetical protein
LTAATRALPSGVTAPRDWEPFARCVAKFASVISGLWTKDMETSSSKNAFSRQLSA